MLKINIIILLFIIQIVLSTNFGSNLQNNSNGEITYNNIPALNQSDISRNNINADNLNIQKYFQKVANVPYRANYTSTKPKTPAKFWKDNYGDCDDKSVAFADYLYKIGAEDVKIVTIVHNSNKYAHCVVMWKNRIFDATADPPIYNMDPEKYYNFIEKQGFKLWIEYPYMPSNK